MRYKIIFGLIVIVYIIMLVSIARSETVQSVCKIETDKAGNHLGLLYELHLQVEPDTLICGQWFKSGAVATTPNIPFRPMGAYCRTSDGEGKVFFAYRYRLGTDCQKASQVLEFRLKQ